MVREGVEVKRRKEEDTEGERSECIVSFGIFPGLLGIQHERRLFLVSISIQQGALGKDSMVWYGDGSALIGIFILISLHDTAWTWYASVWHLAWIGSVWKKLVLILCRASRRANPDLL